MNLAGVNPQDYLKNDNTSLEKLRTQALSPKLELKTEWLQNPWDKKTSASKPWILQKNGPLCTWQRSLLSLGNICASVGLWMRFKLSHIWMKKTCLLESYLARLPPSPFLHKNRNSLCMFLKSSKKQWIFGNKGCVGFFWFLCLFYVKYSLLSV